MKKFLILYVFFLMVQTVQSQSAQSFIEWSAENGITSVDIQLYERGIETIPINRTPWISVSGDSCLSLQNTLKNRSVFFLGEINERTANMIQSLLLYLDTCNSDTITLYINSPGGSVYSALGIYDTMIFTSSPIRTIGDVLCASAAALILSSGAKGNRIVYDGSRIMIHQPRKGEETSSSDKDKAASEVAKLSKELYSILSQNTGKSYSDIERDCQNDFWLTAKEAVDYGLIDRIIK